MKVVGIRLKYNPKLQYYLPKYKERHFVGQAVVVQNTAETIVANLAVVDQEITETEAGTNIQPILRIATPEDLKKVKQNAKKAAEGFELAKRKVAELNLPMKVLDCEISLCGRALFHFTADDRVDFRELVHQLAMAMHCRIELRQISQREVVRQMGGMGNCGRACCCTQGIVNLQKVSIKMAKEQGLSLNMSKISGVCGKLKCCLSYEHDFYLKSMQNMPAIGATVQTPEGEGSVVALNALKNLVSVKIQSGNSAAFKHFAPEQLTVLSDAKATKQTAKINIDTNLE